MRAVILFFVIGCILNALVASAFPVSQIAFDSFAKYDVAASTIREGGVGDNALAEMEAVFKAFAQSTRIPTAEEAVMASPEEVLMMKPMESPEEPMATEEFEVKFTMREEVMASPEVLEASPEGIVMFKTRRAGPMEFPEVSAEPSMELELLEGME